MDNKDYKIGSLFSKMRAADLVRHYRPQRPRFFWSAPRIATSGRVQFFEHAQRIVLYSQPNRFVRLDFEHAQSNEKFVNRGPPVLDLPRVRDSWC